MQIKKTVQFVGYIILISESQAKIEKKPDFESNNFNSHSTRKKDKVDKNDNQSIKPDDETTFPQFSLNVSNPISWKLMLLIMVMQLLTNIMLVVVLYLK